MLRLKLNHVSKRGHWQQIITLTSVDKVLWYDSVGPGYDEWPDIMSPNNYVIMTVVIR